MQRYAPGVAQAMLAEYGLGNSGDSVDYEARVRSRSDRARGNRSSRRRNHTRPQTESNTNSDGGWLSWIYGRNTTTESTSS